MVFQPGNNINFSNLFKVVSAGNVILVITISSCQNGFIYTLDFISFKSIVWLSYTSMLEGFQAWENSNIVVVGGLNMD